MTTPELLEFIRIEHALGMSFSEIIQLLTVEGGWDREDVSEAFRALGLPEEAVETFFAIGKKVEAEVAPIANLNTPKEVVTPSIPDAISQPVQAQTPAQPSKSVHYVGQATPMHYTEEPEKKEKPMLARPASLTGQASRPLVRTLTNAATFAKIDKSKVGGHDGNVVHVSRLEAGHGLSRHSAENYPAANKVISKEVEAAEKLSEIERSLSFGIDIPKEEPKPKSVVSPTSIPPQIKLSDIKPIKIATGGEIEEIEKEEIAKPISSVPRSEEVASLSVEQFTLPKTNTSASAQLPIAEEKKVENIPTDLPILEEQSSAPKTEIIPPPPIPPVEHILEIEEKQVENIPTTLPTVEEITFEPKTKVVLPPPIPFVGHIPKTKEPKVEVSAQAEIKEVEIIPPAPLPLVDAIPKVELPITPDFPKIDATADAIVSPAPTIEIKEELKNVPVEQSQTLSQSTTSVSSPITPPKEPEIKETKVEETKIEAPKVDAPKIPEVAPSAPSFTPPPAPIPPAPIFTPPQPQYVQPPPQYIQLPPQQIFVMPPQMYQQQMPGQMYQQPPQFSSQQPGNMMGDSPHVAEIGSTSPDLEEQAYLAQFGQAKMPEGLVKPQQSMVAPTIIYAPQMTAPVESKKIEEKKPEPIRFDIGRLRTAHKADQSAYSGRPSIVSAVSAMPPVVSKSIEEIFTSPDGQVISTNNSKKDPAHSIKIPHKRTMESDLMNVQEGVVPTQNVTQSQKDTINPSVSTPNTVAATVDEEPIPPPPPKKSTKSILIISLVVFLVIAITSAIAYYFIVLRLPSASEVYKNSLGVAVRGPAMIYDASLSIHTKSTDAEPEYIDVDLFASGTLSIRDKGFEDGNHELNVKVAHTGVPAPFNFDFDGYVSVDDDNVLISQKSPSRGTKIENILKENEWLKVSYRDIGKILGLSSENVVSADDYGQVSQRITLFKLATQNSPIITTGEISKFVKDGKEYYKIPIKLDAKKMVYNGDSLSKYLRGGEATVTGAERTTVLENRYNNIAGEVVVEKLSMKPVSLSLSSTFDASKIPFSGDFKLNINFSFSQQLPVVKIEAETYEEVLARRATEASSEEVIRKDAPYVSVVPILKLAIKQYYDRIGRFPIALDDLVTAGLISTETLPPSMNNNIFYSSYVDKPKDLLSGVRCQAKNTKCDFYHLGINLEYKRAVELQRDADLDTSVISGADDTGCHNETGFACYDMSEDKSVVNP